MEVLEYRALRRAHADVEILLAGCYTPFFIESPEM